MCVSRHLDTNIYIKRFYISLPLTAWPPLPFQCAVTRTPLSGPVPLMGVDASAAAQRRSFLWDMVCLFVVEWRGERGIYG